MYQHAVGKLSHKSAERVPLCPWTHAGLLKWTCDVLLSDVSCTHVAAFHCSGCRSGLCVQQGDGTALQQLLVKRERFLPNPSTKNKLKRQI